MRLASSSLGIVLTLITAASVSVFANCAKNETGDASEEAIGANNSLGLSLRYDDSSGTVQATLKRALGEGEKLYINVRRGKIAYDSQERLDCDELQKAPAIKNGGAADKASGKIVYQGPKVDKSIINLIDLFNDEAWARGTVTQEQRDLRAAGPDPIVEACVTRPGKQPVRLVTNLAYAWDQGTVDGRGPQTTRHGLGLRDGELDAGGGDDGGSADGGVDAGPSPDELTEGRSYSQTKYAQLCVNELGEIPFFPKIEGKENSFETFDCRDLVANGADGRSPHAIAGVEGARIPVTIDDVPQEKCSPGSELGLNDESYSCMDKADRGMYLASLGTQPGPMVVTAKNSKGSHWLLLCRKVSDDGRGMMKTKVFNDMAMIGTNPVTGRTCFFQNSIGSGTDGAHVTHPGDIDKSTAVWSAGVQTYCTGSCHSADAFVHSPWIDGAKHAGGSRHAIVPKMGENDDFRISDNSRPYSIINGDAQGFKIPPQLVSPEVEACTACHRLAGESMMGDFSQWSTGQGSEYRDKITDSYKEFAKSHTMPQRLDGLTRFNWEQSDYATAVKIANDCSGLTRDTDKCKFAKVPSK